MSTIERYARAADQEQWTVGQEFAATFRWEYDDGREKLLNLYEKGKRLQWNAGERIDWSIDLDAENRVLGVEILNAREFLNDFLARGGQLNVPDTIVPEQFEPGSIYALTPNAA